MGFLFLDSANLNDVKSIVGMQSIKGVTTNPSLISKEEKCDYETHLTNICNIIQAESTFVRHLSVEVISLDPGTMFHQADRLYHTLSESYDKVNLHIKIPVLFETIDVISRLVERGVKVNATACMTMEQAAIAHDAGAQVISFFYNRMLDGAEDADLQIRRFCNNHNNSSLVICGSIRKPSDVYKVWTAGADVATVSMKVYKEMLKHRQTDVAVKQFQEDIDKWLK